jgi:hypothetical protein
VERPGPRRRAAAAASDGDRAGVGGITERTAAKSLRARRSLPLSPVAEAALRRWHTVQSAERLRAGTAWHRSDYVFTTESGRLLDRRNAARAYLRALAAGGVKIPPRFHLLRHTAASLMLAEGAVSVRTASEVLGQRDHPDDRRQIRGCRPAGQGGGARRHRRRTGDRLTAVQTAVSQQQRPGHSGVTGPLTCIDGSPGWTRTNNPPVNSRMLCQLSYRGSCAAQASKAVHTP